MSGDVHKEVLEREWEVETPYVIQPMGSHRLKGLETDTDLLSIIPMDLSARKFPEYGTKPEEGSKKLSEQVELLRQEKEHLTNKISEADKSVNDLKGKSEHLMQRLADLLSGKAQLGSEMIKNLFKDSQGLVDGQNKVSRTLLDISKGREQLEDKVNEVLKKAGEPNEEQTRQILKLQIQLKQSLAREEDCQNQILETEKIHSKQLQEYDEQTKKLETDIKAGAIKLSTLLEVMSKIKSGLFVLQDPEDKNPVVPTNSIELDCLAILERLKSNYAIKMKGQKPDPFTFVQNIISHGRTFYGLLEPFKSGTKSWHDLLASFFALQKYANKYPLFFFFVSPEKLIS